MFLRTIQWVREWAIDQVPYRPIRMLIGLAILVILLAILLGIVRLVFNWVDRKLSSWRGRRLREIRWQSQELLSEEDISRVGRGIGVVGRRLAYLLVFLTMVQVVFIIVPETEPIGRTTLGYVTDALAGALAAIVAFLPNLITIAVLYLIASYLARFVRIAFLGIERGRIRISGFEQDWAPTTYKIIRGAIWVLFVVVAFPYFPLSDSPAF